MIKKAIEIVNKELTIINKFFFMIYYFFKKYFINCYSKKIVLKELLFSFKNENYISKEDINEIILYDDHINIGNMKISYNQLYDFRYLDNFFNINILGEISNSEVLITPKVKSIVEIYFFTDNCEYLSKKIKSNLYYHIKYNVV